MWVLVLKFWFGHVRCRRNRPSRDRPFPEPPFPWTAQNLALFSLSRLHFVLFLSLSKCLLVESLRGRRGFTRQPENSKRAHLSAPALQTPPKVHEKTPREGRKERILRKKARKFGPPTLWAPPFGPHPLGPTLPAHTIRAPTPLDSPPHAHPVPGQQRDHPRQLNTHKKN